jgi:hypothetical protein
MSKSAKSARRTTATAAEAAFGEVVQLIQGARQRVGAQDFALDLLLFHRA